MNRNLAEDLLQSLFGCDTDCGDSDDLTFAEDMFSVMRPSKILASGSSALYLGNISNATSLAHANPLGIQVVLDVSTENDYERNPDIEYVRAPFDDGSELSEQKFHQCMELLSKSWDEGKVIQVNCAAGMSRSAGIVVSFLYYKRLGVSEFTPPLDSLDEIIGYVSKCRPIVQIHPRILSSCKKHLKIWPFDGSLEGSVTYAISVFSFWLPCGLCPSHG